MPRLIEALEAERQGRRDVATRNPGRRRPNPPAQKFGLEVTASRPTTIGAVEGIV